MHALDRVLDVERRGSQFDLRTAEAVVEVTFYSARLLRVRTVFPEDGDLTGQTVALPREPEDLPLVVEDGDRFTISTSAMVVAIQRDPLRLVVGDGAGQMICESADGGGIAYEVVGGSRRRVQARFNRAAEEHFYGLGQGGSPGLDRDGTTRRLWASHYGHGPGTDLPVPLLLSSRGYGLFFDNSWDAEVQVGRHDARNTIVYTAEGGVLDWYFFYGPSLKQLLAEYADLTGHPPMPPR